MTSWGSFGAFRQFLIGLLKSKGGHICARVDAESCEVRGMDICRSMVEPSAEPVYYQDGSVVRCFGRTGNGTRELDAHKAIVHLARRRREAGMPFPESN